MSRWKRCVSGCVGRSRSGSRCGHGGIVGRSNIVSSFLFCPWTFFMIWRRVSIIRLFLPLCFGHCHHIFPSWVVVMPTFLSWHSLYDLSPISFYEKSLFLPLPPLVVVLAVLIMSKDWVARAMCFASCGSTVYSIPGARLFKIDIVLSCCSNELEAIISFILISTSVDILLTCLVQPMNLSFLAERRRSKTWQWSKL